MRASDLAVSTAELETKLWQELTTLECNKTMPYVTSVERIGYQRGHLEGHHEEASALVQRLLRRRFGALAAEGSRSASPPCRWSAARL